MTFKSLCLEHIKLYIYSVLILKISVTATISEKSTSFKCNVSDYPFLVLLKSNNPTSFCGGALIKNDTVLTAPYCTSNFIHSPEKLEVLFNVSKDFPNGTERSRAEKIFLYPNTDKFPVNNIAVIGLETPIAGGKPIKLPQTNSGNGSEICDRVLTMAYTYETNMESCVLDPQLYCLNLPIVNEDECRQMNRKNTDAFSCRFPGANGSGKSWKDYPGYPVFCGDTFYGVVAKADNFSLSDFANYPIRVDFVIDFLHQRTMRKRVNKFVQRKTNGSCSFFGSIAVCLFLICFSVK